MTPKAQHVALTWMYTGDVHNKNPAWQESGHIMLYKCETAQQAISTYSVRCRAPLQSAPDKRSLATTLPHIVRADAA